MQNKLLLLWLLCVACVPVQAQGHRPYERGDFTFKTTKIKDANGEYAQVKVGAYVGNDLIRERTYEMVPTSSESVAEHLGRVSEEDINFDGYPDVDIYLGYMGGFANNIYHEGWLWDQTSHSFVDAEGYGGIGDPVCDSEKKYICTILSNGPNHRVTTYYRWQGHRLQEYLTNTWAIDSDDYEDFSGLLNAPCYRFDAKLDGRIPVNVVFQKNEAGILAGYIYYPRAKRPAPILIRGSVSQHDGTDHFQLTEYMPDGHVTGEISLRVKLDEYYYGRTVEGEWTNPETKTPMTMQGLRFSREMPKWFTKSVLPSEPKLLKLEEMPKTAVRHPYAFFQHAVYINVDRPSANEGEVEAICSVWLADEKAGTVIKVCVTNPMAELQWSRMPGRDADGVDVPITQIAAAEKAYIAPGDVSKVIVEGCPDNRNIWTYIIDPYAQTAIQLPSTEGVVNLDWEKKEIIAASYGYDDDGRYSVKKAYSLEGKFLRRVGEKERE